jgi:hypothetical protein
MFSEVKRKTCPPPILFVVLMLCDFYLLFVWINTSGYNPIDNIHTLTIPDKIAHQQVATNISFTDFPGIQIYPEEHTIITGSTVKVFHIQINTRGMSLRFIIRRRITRYFYIL